jgi:hypothetical protein
MTMNTEKVRTKGASRALLHCSARRQKACRVEASTAKGFRVLGVWLCQTLCSNSETCIYQRWVSAWYALSWGERVQGILHSITWRLNVVRRW